MNVLYVVWSFPASSETFILNQITGLIDRGHTVSILSLGPGDTAGLHADVTAYGLLERTTYLPAPAPRLLPRVRQALALLPGNLMAHPWTTLRALDPRLGSIAHSLQLYFASAGDVGSLEPDVVHCHFGGVGAVVVAMREIGLLQAPIVATFHGHDIRHGVEHGAARYRLLARRAQRVIAISPGNRRALASFGFRDEQIVDHPVGIEQQRFHACRARRVAPEMGAPVRLLTVARLVKEKALDVLLQAYARVRARSPELAFHATVIGAGRLRAELEQQRSMLNLTGCVSFVGAKPQADVLNALADSDVFVLASRAEVLPVSLMEAHAAGLPVVATRVGDVDSIVQHGRSGLLARPEDPESLADALTEMLQNRLGWAAMGEVGQRHVELHFDIGRLNDRLQALLAQVSTQRWDR